jgi:hypothetical protein
MTFSRLLKSDFRTITMRGVRSQPKGKVSFHEPDGITSSGERIHQNDSLSFLDHQPGLIKWQ